MGRFPLVFTPEGQTKTRKESRGVVRELTRQLESSTAAPEPMMANTSLALVPRITIDGANKRTIARTNELALLDSAVALITLQLH
jgi:hypothetical protein